MGNYKARPIIISAMQWPGVFTDSIEATLTFERWITSVTEETFKYKGQLFICHQGSAEPNDWVVINKGVIYCYADKEFKRLYEEVVT